MADLVWGLLKEKWHNFGEKTAEQAARDNDATLVFYRVGEASEPSAVNIHIDGEYQTSLQQHGYSEAVVCAQPQRIGAFVTGQDRRYHQKHNRGEFYRPQAGKVAFFRVSTNPNGQAVIEQVGKDVADEEMKSVNYQTNTLPRVSKARDCSDAGKQRQYVLNASALFSFNQSNSQDMTDAGRAEIAKIAEDVRDYPEKIQAIEVIGYTDPEGDAGYNQKLSQQRAEAVKALLIQAGVAGNLIQAVGRGEENLVAPGCAAKSKDKQSLQACNQPNRRVEIKLHTAQQ